VPLRAPHCACRLALLAVCGGARAISAARSCAASPRYASSGGSRLHACATETFVFLSGLPLGLVNGRSIRRGDLGTALEKSVTRAGTPYGITGGLTLLTARRHGDLSR